MMQYKIYDPELLPIKKYGVPVYKITPIFDGTFLAQKVENFKTLLRYEHWHLCEVHVHPLDDEQEAKQKLEAKWKEVFLNVNNE